MTKVTGKFCHYVQGNWHSATGSTPTVLAPVDGMELPMEAQELSSNLYLGITDSCPRYFGNIQEPRMCSVAAESGHLNSGDFPLLSPTMDRRNGIACIVSEDYSIGR